MVRRGLGSGLSILLGENSSFEPVSADESSINYIDIDKIIPNPDQPRKTFDIALLNELSESIKEYGVLQPILLIKNEAADNFIIIAGERRFRASKIAGLKQVPALVLKNKNHEEQYKIAILENIQRENLNPVEEAEAYKFLIENFGYTHDILAEKLNKSRSYITNALRMLKLPEEVVNMVSEGQISSGHAKVLSGVPADKVSDLAKKIVSTKISVRELEKQVKKEKVIQNIKPQTLSDHVREQISSMIDSGDQNHFDKNATLSEISSEITQITGYATKLVDNGRSIFMNIEIGSVKDLAALVDSILKQFDK